MTHDPRGTGLFPEPIPWNGDPEPGPADDRLCDRCHEPIEEWWNYCAMCGHHIAGGTMTEALCLSQDSPFRSTFKKATARCPAWRSNHHGAVDAPPNYGEQSCAAYEAEDRP